MSDGVVLDASAVLCLLKDEPGADIVIAALPNAVISAVNLSKVVAKLSDAGGSERKIVQAIGVLRLVVEPFEAEQARIAGMLRAVTRSLGLSLGVRACLALARYRRGTALTTDKAWADLPQELGLSIKVIR